MLSFSRAHTWKKCSFVTEIIQHVEYSVTVQGLGFGADGTRG